MPVEYGLLKYAPVPHTTCPACNVPFEPFLRGMIQRSRRKWGFLWRQPYCCVICAACKDIVGYEYPWVAYAPHGAERGE